MGAPLVGSHVQASVLTGGSLHFKGLRPRLQSKRLQMICEWLQRGAGLLRSQSAAKLGGVATMVLQSPAKLMCLCSRPMPCSPAQGRGAAGPGVAGGQEAAW